MKIIRLLFIWMLSCLLLNGCYQEVDLSVPFEGSKMVLEGYLSPKKGLDLRIKKTFDPYQHTEFDEDGYLVAQAKVHIWHDGALIDSCREIEKGHYLSLHPEKYEANENYVVRITALELKEVHVSDIRIPAESLVVSENFSFKIHEEKAYLLLNATFQNPEFYAIYLGKSWHDSQAKNSLQTSIIMDENIIEECDGDLLFFSNKCEAGNTFEKTFLSELYRRELHSWDKVFLPKQYIYFEVGQVDPRFKDYIEKSDASDEPFIEPSLDSGNVEGGYGFIVGWNAVSFTYRL